MKNFIILLAILGFSATAVLADNVKPASSAKVSLEHNGFNLVKVAVDQADADKVVVKFYDRNFNLLHTETIKSANEKTFDISKLEKGHYLVKVVAKGEMVYTTAIEKVK